MVDHKERLECDGCDDETTHCYVSNSPENGFLYECMACGKWQVVSDE